MCRCQVSVLLVVVSVAVVRQMGSSRRVRCLRLRRWSVVPSDRLGRCLVGNCVCEVVLVFGVVAVVVGRCRLFVGR